MKHISDHMMHIPSKNTIENSNATLFMRYKITFHKYLESVKMIFLFIWIWKPNIMIWAIVCVCAGVVVEISLSLFFLSDFTTKFKSPHSLGRGGGRTQTDQNGLNQWDKGMTNRLPIFSPFGNRHLSRAL